MNILFLTFHGFSPNNGISKKILYQVNALKACGNHVHLCYMDEKESKKRMVDNTVIADYGNGTISKIKKRVDFSSIVKYCKDYDIKFVYIRSDNNASPFTIWMIRRMQSAGIKVAMEIPTYPYDSEYVSQGLGKQIIVDRLFRKCQATQLDAIVTFSNYDRIFGQRTIKISNGIDFDSIKIKTSVHDTKKTLSLIGVAEIHQWHGFDRLIKGLANYYSEHKDYIVYFHLVGYFFSKREENIFRQSITDNGLSPYVVLHGKKHEEELDAIFDQCDLGIGSLGRHRVGIRKIKTLKNREYAARGIPFIYSEDDSDFDNMPYVLKVPADETPIDICSIISFYQHLSLSPKEIRDSIKNLSWENQMRRVLMEIFKERIILEKINEE